MRASRVPRDVVEALEQDLSEAHPSSQSQFVTVAHADPSESGRVMGVAEIVDISTPRGAVWFFSHSSCTIPVADLA